MLEQIRSVDPDRMAREAPVPFDGLLRRLLQPELDHRQITMREVADTLLDARLTFAAIDPIV